MTVKDILKKIMSKELSYTELVSSYFEKIEKEDKELRSYLYVAKDSAFKKAKVLDSAKAGIIPALGGVPYAVKDNILVEGMQATAASRILENYVAPYNATVIEKLNKAGGIILGKTNLDEFAMGSSTENSAFGSTKNPNDLTRVPGGSSGGSAACVAAGLASFALGSDTGGSVRQPAAFCGVVGFKPTYGAVSRYGLIAMASSLDQIGILTQTVEDAKLVFQNMVGRDRMDSTSHDIFMPEDFKPIQDLTIGIPKEYFQEGLDERIKNKIFEAIEAYKKGGVKVKEISLPHAPFSLAVYYIIMPSEVSSNLARFDGIKYGAHGKLESHENLMDYYSKLRGENFGKEVKRRIMLGTYTLSAGYYDAYYLKAQKVRALIEQDFEKAFQEVDLIVSPTTPSLPFKFGEKTEDPLAMYLADVYTVSANLAGLPSISIPVGTIQEEGKALPVGMQIMAPRQLDFKLLDVAGWYEKAVK